MGNDQGLAFLLQYENIAWYEGGRVRILDRRVYPEQETFVVCEDYPAVARAIADMVTQSYGPFQAAMMGMALAANACRHHPAAEQKAFMKQAADTLATARPTTERKMRLLTDGAEQAAARAIDGGGNACDAVMAYALDVLNNKYARIAVIGRRLADRIPRGGAVMTQCYADCDLGMLLRALWEKGNPVRFFVPETRPYLQGARLTASVILDMGFDVTLITDNMPAFTMQQKGIDVFTSAADVITLDGHVVNKVGTYQIAIAAKHHGIPYYCTGIPNAVHPDAASVRIEERDPEEVLSFAGTRIAKAGVKAYYPAFDVTPPELVTGVVTEKGIFAPTELMRYFDE